MRDPEPVEQLRDAPAPAEADVPLDREMREEGVLLEDEPDPAVLRRPVDPALGVEQGLAADGDPAAAWPGQAGDDAQYRRLPGPGRPDERERLPLDLER